MPRKIIPQNLLPTRFRLRMDALGEKNIRINFGAKRIYVCQAISPKLIHECESGFY